MACMASRRLQDADQRRLEAAQRESRMAQPHGDRLAARQAAGDDAQRLAGQEADLHQAQQQVVVLRALRGQQPHDRGFGACLQAAQRNSCHLIPYPASGGSQQE